MTFRSISKTVFFSILFVCTNLFQTADCATSNLVERPKRSLFVVLKISNLSMSSKELAEQLEIMPLLNELYDQSHPLDDASKTSLRERILETILESYFDAVSVQAEAEREQIRIEALRESLIDKRDHDVELNNATNFITSGTLNTVGSALGFTTKLPPLPGNLNQMLSGVVTMGMSTYSLKQNHGGKSVGLGTPTILAELFGRPTDERTTYPETVWRFIHGQVPESSDLTRAERLEMQWIQRKQLEPHGSSKEKRKLDLVCGVLHSRKLMTIDDLTDQINMIADVSAVASLMTHHLRDLLRMIDSDLIFP